jgi:hypothetical protein
MSLRDLAAADSRAILLDDGAPVTITAPSSLGGAVYRVRGQVIRVGLSLDSNGMPVAADKTALTVTIADLLEAGLSDPELLKKSGWLAEAPDSTGATISGTIDLVALDRTLDRATIHVKRSA